MVTIDSDSDLNIVKFLVQSLKNTNLIRQPASLFSKTSDSYTPIKGEGEVFSRYWISALHWEAQQALERDPKMASQSSQEEVMFLWQKALTTSEFESSFRSNYSLQVGDARFAELLKPIKDLTQNWQVLTLSFPCNRNLYLSHEFHDIMHIGLSGSSGGYLVQLHGGASPRRGHLRWWADLGQLCTSENTIFMLLSA